MLKLSTCLFLLCFFISTCHHTAYIPSIYVSNAL
nr:MAG TPA: hypothetical protein [Caudoviricetes sp.]